MQRLDSGKPACGGLELSHWGPGGMTALYRLIRHLKQKVQVKGKATKVILGSVKAKHHSLSPLPLAGNLPPLGCSSPPEGPVFFVNHSTCASLVSHSKCEFPEDRDLS